MRRMSVRWSRMASGGMEALRGGSRRRCVHLQEGVHCSGSYKALHTHIYKPCVTEAQTHMQPLCWWRCAVEARGHAFPAATQPSPVPRLRHALSPICQVPELPACCLQPPSTPASLAACCDHGLLVTAPCSALHGDIVAASAPSMLRKARLPRARRLLLLLLLLHQYSAHCLCSMCQRSRGVPMGCCRPPDHEAAACQRRLRRPEAVMLMLLMLSPPPLRHELRRVADVTAGRVAAVLSRSCWMIRATGTFRPAVHQVAGGG